MAEPEQYLIQRAREALATDPRVSELHVQVTVAGGKVFLTGSVPTAERREAAASLVSEVLPDHEVRNQLTVDAIDGGPEVEELS